MKPWLKKFIPTEASLKKKNEIKVLKPFLHTPGLWHFDEQCVARGMAAGLAGCVIPGFQMIYAALLAILFRGNLYVALVATLVTNPLTIIPIMFGICVIGSTVIGNGTSSCVVHKFNWDVSSFHAFWMNVMDWLMQFGKAFLIGVPIASVCLAVVGYFGTILVWRTCRLLARKI